MIKSQVSILAKIAIELSLSLGQTEERKSDGLRMIVRTTIALLMMIHPLFITNVNAQSIPIAQVSTSQGEILFNQARSLYQKGTPESIREAIDLLQQSLSIFKQAKDIKGEAIVLNYLGLMHNSLKEPKKALEFYQKALPLWAKLGNDDFAKSAQATTLNMIGDIYNNLGEKAPALTYYNQALPILKAVGDVSNEATTLNNMGSIYESLGERQKALEYYQQSLTLLKKTDEQNKTAITLNNIAGVYDNLGKYQEAIEYYQQALSLRKTLDDRFGQAQTLNSLASIYEVTGDRQKARENYQLALELWQALDHKFGQAITLNSLGRVADALGEKTKALEYFQQVLPMWDQISNPALATQGKAATLNNMGSVYNDLGEKRQALTYYQQAGSLLSKNDSLTAIAGQAAIFSNMGRIYNIFGEKSEALKYYEQALNLWQKYGKNPTADQVSAQRGEATTLNNMAIVYNSIGEQQKALDYYQRSLSLSTKIGAKNNQATTLTSMGGVYDQIGEPNQALAYYNQALPLLQEVGDQAGTAATLNNIGLVYFSLADREKALTYYQQALPLTEKVGDQNGQALTLNNIGLVYHSLANYQQAIEFYQKALPILKKLGNKAGEAVTLNNIGGSYNELGNQSQALNYYQQALPLSRVTNDQSSEANILFSIASLQADQGNLKEALVQIENAIKIIENLRTKLINPDLQTSYFASVQDYYEFYINLLMRLHQENPQKGYDRHALEASERGRARTLLELLKESQMDITNGVDRTLLQKDKTIQQRLDSLETRLVKFGANLTETEKNLLLKEQAELLKEYQENQVKIRATSKRYAHLTQPEPLTVKAIQEKLLDEQTLLLEYSLGKQKSYLWVVSHNNITTYQLPPGPEIEQVAKEFRIALTHPLRKDRIPLIDEAADNLSKLILEPVGNSLGEKRLVIVADRTLQYTPFAALSIPGTVGGGTNYQPLITRHEIINLPSASALAIIREEKSDRPVFSKILNMIADPVFSPKDARVTDSSLIAALPSPEIAKIERSAQELGIEWSRLLGTRQEAENILALIPEGERSASFDFQSNRESIINGNLSQYQILHFATHGFVNTAQPELSGIVLSMVDQKGNWQNGYLRLNDIFNLNLPAELVVLSACQTGLGKEVRGEGIVGLTRGFMYAGTPRVIASLWRVDDQQTAALMLKLYQGIIPEKLTPAAALRQAQLQMWQQEKSPYYWAAFTLQGEWR